MHVERTDINTQLRVLRGFVIITVFIEPKPFRVASPIYGMADCVVLAICGLCTDGSRLLAGKVGSRDCEASIFQMFYGINGFLIWVDHNERIFAIS